MPVRQPLEFGARLLPTGAQRCNRPDTGDYVPPVTVASVRLTKDVVKASDAVGAAPLRMISTEVGEGRLATLPVRLPWMHTAYGFIYLRARMLSPAALALMAEVRTVEDGIVAEERVIDEAAAGCVRYTPARGKRSGKDRSTRAA
jgi:DNA-binding transcriptional LysR family regulator